MAESDLNHPDRTRPAPPVRIRARLRRFLRTTHAGATSIVILAVSIMTVGGSALIVDHNWLYDQRDALKYASDAAAVASTIELERHRDSMSPEDLVAMLDEIAHTFASLNLTHLSGDRLTRAIDSLVVKVTPRAGENSVDVYVSADLGGTLFSRHLPLTDNYEGPDIIAVASGVEVLATPVEVVLALDTSSSMARTLAGNWTHTASLRRIEILKKSAKELVSVLRPSAANRIAVGVVPWSSFVKLSTTLRWRWRTRGWAMYPASKRFYVPYACHFGRLNACTANRNPVDQMLPSHPPETWKGCLDEFRVTAVGFASHAEEENWFDEPSTSPFAQAFYPSLYGSAYECQRNPFPPGFGYQACFETSYVDKQLSCKPGGWHIFPLSTDPIGIDRAIDRLRAIGDDTYSALGVLWGQRVLTHTYRDNWGGTTHPLDPNIEANVDVRKAIVLLTDGEDTRCGSYDPSCDTSGLAIKREDACAAAKAQGTEIFVIAAMASVSSTLADGLRDCSSESDNPAGSYVFLDHSDEDSLTATFTTIANQLHIVRRTH